MFVLGNTRRLSLVSVIWRCQKECDKLIRDLWKHGFHSTSCCWKTKPTSLKGKTTSSQKWIARQLNDPYIQRAKEENYRCRSAFKLLEIDEKFHIFHKGDIVIDCGAAPGSWTQVAVQRVLRNGDAVGKVISIDIQGISPIQGAITLSHHDFTTQETMNKVTDILEGDKANVIISDMAPNATGHKDSDHGNVIELCFSVLKFSTNNLSPGGTVLCKLWQGFQQSRLEKTMRLLFDDVRVVKPFASRPDSAEIFLLGRDFRKLTPKT